MIKIVKKETGNVFIYKGGRLESTLQPDASITLLSYADGIAILDDSGQSFDLVTSSVSETQIEPAGSTPFNGTTQELIELLAESFFFITGSGGGGGVPVGQVLYMRLNSSQDLNVIQPFTDLDFVEVTNTIPNASVSSNFPIGAQTYKGVVTLPAGKYKSSYRINAQNGTNTQKVVVTNISRYAPSVIYYPESTTFQMFRGRNNFASITNSDANYEFFELSQSESFGVISTRTAAGGACNSVPDQSFWKIEKIG